MMLTFQGEGAQQLQETAKAIEEWPVYKTSDPSVAQAVGVSHPPGFIVGTNFDYNGGKFVAVSGEGHRALEGSQPLRERLLNFVRTEQLPPYLPYSSATNERVFGMPRQVSIK